MPIGHADREETPMQVDNTARPIETSCARQVSYNGRSQVASQN